VIDVPLIADSLVRATPLIISGLSVAFAFRGGVFNIGAEGQLLMGATASTTVILLFGESLGSFAVVAALVAAAIAGAIWAGIAAELRRRFQVLEIISTIMLNFIAIHLVSFLVRGPLQEPTKIYPQTLTIPTNARLPVILAGTRLHLGFIIAIALGVLLAWFFRRTAAGFRIRAVGASPSAAWSAGRIRVDATMVSVFVISGALAGIAGGVEVTGVTYALYENLSPGYGYTAIAVALIAGLNPLAVVASGVFFGALETGATAIQRELAVPSSLASVVEALLILAAVSVAVLRGKRLLGTR
jgi:simple sugar transport system permease protein